jgi:hypothetical protein
VVCGWAMPVSTCQDDGEDHDLAMRVYTALRERVSWFTILRLYGPLEGYMDRSWKPSDIEQV